MRGNNVKEKKDLFKVGQVQCTTRGNGFKLKKGKFRLDNKKNFPTGTVIQQHSSLEREAAQALSTDTFQLTPASALRGKIPGVNHKRSQGFDSTVYKDHSKPNIYDPVINTHITY